MVTLSRLDQIERYQAALYEISQDPYANFEHLGNLLLLANQADSYIATKLFAQLSNALAEIKDIHFDYFCLSNSLQLIGMVPDAVVLCFRLGELLQNSIIEDYKFKCYLREASCNLMWFLVRNRSFPIGVLVENVFKENVFEEKFENNKSLERLIAECRATAIMKRSDEFFNYLRKKLKDDLVDSSSLTDEMLLAVFGFYQ